MTIKRIRTIKEIKQEKQKALKELKEKYIVDTYNGYKVISYEYAPARNKFITEDSKKTLPEIEKAVKYYGVKNEKVYRKLRG